MHHIGTQSIETERLTLRRLLPADAQQMYTNWASDPRVTAHLRWDPHKSAEETRSLLTAWAELYANANYYQWCLVEKASGAVFGTISIENALAGNPSAHDQWPGFDASAGIWEAGYCIGHPWWGRGLMTEALRAVVEYWFTRVNGDWLTCCHAVSNPASGRVMQKAGFERHHDGISKRYDGTPVDCRFFCLTHQRYDDLRSAAANI